MADLTQEAILEAAQELPPLAENDPLANLDFPMQTITEPTPRPAGAGKCAVVMAEKVGPPVINAEEKAAPPLPTAPVSRKAARAAQKAAVVPLNDNVVRGIADQLRSGLAILTATTDPKIQRAASKLGESILWLETYLRDSAKQ